MPSLFMISFFFPLQQQMVAAISKLRREYQQLEARFKTYTGEDLSSLNSVVELAMLEKQLESAISKVHARKVYTAQ